MTIINEKGNNMSKYNPVTFQKAIDKHGDNKSAIARELNLSRQSVHTMMAKHLPLKIGTDKIDLDMDARIDSLELRVSELEAMIKEILG